LRIGIDGRILSTDRGMGRALRFILEPLFELGASDDFYLYTGPAPLRVPVRSNVRVRPLATGVVPIYEQIYLPRAVSKDSLDVLWCPPNTGPSRLKTPVVLTLHDVIFRHRGALLPPSPSLYQRLGRTYTDWSATRLTKSAARIVTISEFSAAEIRDLLHVPPEKISVIPLGVSIAEPGDLITDEALRAMGIQRPFFLFLGAVDPRKNTEFTIDVFLDSAAADETQLVVAGLRPSESEPHKRRIAGHRRAGSAVFLDFVGDSVLAGLYRTCLAFVFSSLFEGFGLPVLEAMHFGTPVLGSNQTCIPEIGGDAILYFDPRSREALSDGLTKLMRDPKLRKTLSEAGLLRARQFSWQSSAERLLQTLRSVGA
jgi:glycosyltransferase involved in cell wall biosynthesis